jgi:hypothetical protein
MWAMKEIGGNLPQLDQFGLAEGVTFQRRFFLIGTSPACRFL